MLLEMGWGGLLFQQATPTVGDGMRWPAFPAGHPAAGDVMGWPAGKVGYPAVGDGYTYMYMYKPLYMQPFQFKAICSAKPAVSRVHGVHPSLLMASLPEHLQSQLKFAACAPHLVHHARCARQ